MRSVADAMAEERYENDVLYPKMSRDAGDDAATVFASVVESHGSYSPVSEIAANSNSNIAKLKLVYDDKNYTAIAIENLQGKTSTFIVSNTDASISGKHQIMIDGQTFKWTGPYHYNR